ncbi:MAG: bifunctional pyr operon transcriptional regulator/uracil phosphoribosyltransferase PyrR [Saprospiraceae bacterium]|nr:bifunctional pyr operon transcriptional regulator/uracil phosphoribosyltransferase PyrR [Saprospiraceae bacterium]
MTTSRIISEKEQFDLTLERLCYHLIEDYDDFKDTCFVGIQTGGVTLAERVLSKLRLITNNALDVPFGKLDITFYRDDFRTSKKPLAANINDMAFLIENQRVILFDDVLYTGRSVQSAMTALNHYGRPISIKLMVLVDRRFHRQLPVRADYIGVAVDALDDSYVQVEWLDTDVSAQSEPQQVGADRIMHLFKKQ